MLKFFSWNVDFVGFWVSLLCALHCMLMPMILTLGIFAGARWQLNSLIEWIFIGASFSLASWSLLRSYFQKHQNIGPLLLSGLGFLGIFLAQLFIVSKLHLLMAIGGGLIAYAHFYNWQLTDHKKTALKKSWRRFTPNTIIIVFLLVLYFFGFRSALMHDKTPPSREEILQVVWRGRK